MSAINTRIVHRTNALSEHAYGTRIRYDEACDVRGLKGQLASAARRPASPASCSQRCRAPCVASSSGRAS